MKDDMFDAVEFLRKTEIKPGQRKGGLFSVLTYICGDKVKQSTLIFATEKFLNIMQVTFACFLLIKYKIRKLSMVQCPGETNDTIKKHKICFKRDKINFSPFLIQNSRHIALHYGVLLPCF